MTNRTLTLVDALFQEAYICASVGSATRDYNSRPEVRMQVHSAGSQRIAASSEKRQNERNGAGLQRRFAARGCHNSRRGLPKRGCETAKVRALVPCAKQRFASTSRTPCALRPIDWAAGNEVSRFPQIPRPWGFEVSRNRVSPKSRFLEIPRPRGFEVPRKPPSPCVFRPSGSRGTGARLRVRRARTPGHRTSKSVKS